MNFVITNYNIEVPHNYDYKTRVLVLSDVHDQHYDLLIDVMNELMFDIIFITGDLCTKHISNTKHNDGFKKCGISYGALEFLKYCVGKTKTYYSLGNHEWMFDADDIKTIDSIGCVLLNDRYVRVSDNVYIGGIKSPLKYEKNGILPEYYAPDIKWLDQYENEIGYKFLLCHHPEYYDKYLRKRDIDLIISGHAHGGQIRLGNQGLYAPGQGLFPKYTSGYVDKKIVISRGLANTAKIIPRINNKPEIVILNMVISN